MLVYHHGVAIQPSVTRSGNTFVARVCILEEDGEATSLGDLGHFANSQSAFAFAVRCGAARHLSMTSRCRGLRSPISPRQHSTLETERFAGNRLR
ncbi:hypothetical protein LMG24235_07268 [Paraburkholderia sabiae]|nr:hypothetical protein LMG24235_07268 [Paraburkholderia sabiae]